MYQYIELMEWDSVLLEDRQLLDEESREIADLLMEKRIIEIRELRNGLDIRTNSYVGRVIIGDMQININPKIKGMPLYKLLNYTYGLKDIKLMRNSGHNIGDLSFFDLIIYELFLEVEDLLYKGIQRQYIKREEELFSPRGRIDINSISKDGGIIREKLACIYFNRDEDYLLNQVLFAGLRLGADLVIDKNLKIEILNLCNKFQEEISPINLTRGNLQTAKNSINRLTKRYDSSLEIINILFESQSIQLEDSNRRLNLTGYFFDMNSFFETLIGKLLGDYNSFYSIKNQFSLHDLFIYTPDYNPLAKKAPTPRPDFAIMSKGKVTKLMDAKYRDLWENSLPTDMLYQLAIYAASGVGNNTSTIIYPTIDNNASVQKININNPVSSAKFATVILQPINLIKIADLLYDDEEELAEYIDGLLFM